MTAKIIKDFPVDRVSADVLVIGGGIAGCMAAISAAKLGVKVVLAEKGHVRRSGCAATGVDHFHAYVPEIHGSKGYSVQDIADDLMGEAEGFAEKGLLEEWARNSYARLLDLERYGVPIRDNDGCLRLVGRFGRLPSSIHFAGQNLKVKLAEAAAKEGVTVLNRVMIVDLLVEDGRVVGAIGLSVREERVYALLAKSTVIATGDTSRLFRNPTGLAFNSEHPPSNVGDGMAMAYRAGAELLNMEFLYFHSGPKNFHRCGRGSYYPRCYITDGQGNRLGVSKEGFMDLKVQDSSALHHAVKEGRGPLYMDCRDTTANDIEYIRWALSNEGNTAYLDYLDQEGVDLQKHRLEFGVYAPRISGLRGSGICINTKTGTSLEGLFAAGDVAGGVRRLGASGAATFGWIAGESAAKRSLSIEPPSISSHVKERVEMKRSMYQEILSRDIGIRWLDAQHAVANLMSDYAFEPRSEPSLKAGLARLKAIRQLVHGRFNADNAHEMSRCMEVLNLLDVGEMVILTALERKESRMTHHRIDYPESREDWKRILVMKKSGEKIIFRKKPID